jgi:exopolysaccharide biosynthesis polyprenyl glycosylphosphotransferase
LQIFDLCGFLGAWAVVQIGATHSSDRFIHLLVIVAAASLAAAAQGLYHARAGTMRFAACSRLLAASAVSGIVAFALSARTDAHPSIARPIVGAALAWILTSFGRSFFEVWLANARQGGGYLRRVVLVGSSEDAQEFYRFIAASPELGFLPVAWVGGNEDPHVGIPWSGPVASASLAAAVADASGAILFSDGLSMPQLTAVTRSLHEAGLDVHLSSGLLGINYRRVRSVPVGHEPFMYIGARTRSRRQLAAKRVIDVVVGSIAIVTCLPVIAVAALAIKVTDGGPIFFRQTRIGRQGRPIRIWKLRTMTVDAEARLAEIQHLNDRTGPLFKACRDPRVTRVGRLLRASSIDELPQLINVVRGEMSLVGPRPALPWEADAFDDELLTRLRVLPGMTGLWQVEARDRPSFEEYRRLDLFYVENWSVGLDLAILVDTIPSVLTSFLRRMSRELRPAETLDLREPDMQPLDLDRVVSGVPTSVGVGVAAIAD